MASSNLLWDRLGDLEEDESFHVMTRLFALYEEILERDSDNREAQHFFNNLENALDYCRQCNLNRR